MQTQVEMDFAVVAGARATDPETSHAAAKVVEASGVAGAQRRLALEIAQTCPGMSTYHMARLYAEHAGLAPVTLRYMLARRMPELERLGLVFRAGNDDRGGCWFLTEQGKGKQ